MKVCIFGLGYVGIVTAGCLVRQGHQVVGVDVSPSKVEALRAGRSPIIEEGIDELIAQAAASGRFTATLHVAEALRECDLALVCVGTPSAASGSLGTRYVETVLRQIGAELHARTTPLPIAIRSTMLPGTVRNLAVPCLAEATGAPAGVKFEALFHPEFLREGTSIKDYFDPPKIVVGERVPGAGDRLMELYEGFTAPVFRTSYETAEMVKYCDNIFHALKVTFANEVGQFCRAHACDSREVMEIFCADRKLNLSPRYLRPGFAFGGSCLPKDLRALLFAARRAETPLPLLASILPSNEGLIERAAQQILETGARRIGFYGLAFKPGTDDLRESPLVALAERLLGKGAELHIFDPFVEVTRIMGGNQAYIEQHLPHLSRLLVHQFDALAGCPLVVVGHPPEAAHVESLVRSGVRVLDLVGVRPVPPSPAWIPFC